MAMGVESPFNSHIERKYPEWRELDGATFHSVSRISFQEVANAELMDTNMAIAEATFLALSRASTDSKSYKEVQAFFDEIWDGEWESIGLSIRKAVNRYNVRFTEKRQKV